VYVGFAAQVPFALTGYLAARAFLRWADAAARVLMPGVAFALRRALLPVPAGEPWLGCSPLAFDRLGRAPPRS
jgi:hypothetical protein